MLRNACIFLKRLQQEGLEIRRIRECIEDADPSDDFAESVMEIIEIADVDPHNLEIEVSEAILIEYYDLVAGKLNTLKKQGIRIALDNFGRGYSALNYLRKLPITTVKIDKSFTDIITVGEESRILTDFMLKTREHEAANRWRRVENKEQFDYLKENGCHRLQGYYLSRPLPERDAIRKLHDAEAGAD